MAPKVPTTQPLQEKAQGLKKKIKTLILTELSEGLSADVEVSTDRRGSAGKQPDTKCYCFTTVSSHSNVKTSGVKGNVHRVLEYSQTLLS